MIRGKSKNKDIFIQIPTKSNGFNILNSHKALNSTDKLVFGEVYTMLKTTTSFFMSNRGFAKRIGMSKRSVAHSLKKLRSLGIIKTRIVKKNRLIVGRYIYLGSANTHHSSANVPEGGANMPKGSANTHPNRSVSISNSRSSENRSNLNSKQKKIKTYLIEHFPKFNSIIKIQNLDDAIITWTGTYPLENIRKAIERTVNYQMRHGLINVPMAFISKTLQNITYSKEPVKPKRHPTEHVSTVDDLMARERKNAEKSDEKFLNQLKDRKGVK